MKLLERARARRQRKAHERYLRERERQRELEARDPQQAIRDISTRAAGNQQGGAVQ